jgi:hypothetical protein
MNSSNVSVNLYDCFLEGAFEKALDMYSEAIFCKVPKKNKAVYYSNRAFTNIKLENYAIALYGKIIELIETFFRCKGRY